MGFELTITPASRRRRRVEPARRVTVSFHPTVGEAEREARDHLRANGGGSLSVKRRGKIVASESIPPDAPTRPR